MAYSKVPFTYTSGPQVFPTNFALGVLEADHIKVYVDGVVDGLGEPVEYAFTYNAANGDVTVTDALTSGQTGTINRIVPIDTLIADFEAGADVSKRNLVRAVKQTLMAVQEAADSRDADSKLLQDTKEDIDLLVASIDGDVAAVNAAVVAATSQANTATTQATNAATSASNASTSASNAAASAASVNLPSIVGNALRFLRVRADTLGYEFRTPDQVLGDLGVTATAAELNHVDGVTSPIQAQLDGKQAALGFTPVEQGGVAGMAPDKVRIGWRSDARGLDLNVNGTPIGRALRTLEIGAGFNDTMIAPGSAPLYACRAWVNFNGTNGATRAAGNVSSVVRNGVGDYTINFATVMPDANYGVVVTTNEPGNGFVISASIQSMTTSSVRFRCQSANHANYDGSLVNVAIFR